MAQYFVIHPTHPQARLVRRAADIVRKGGLIAYPTDSCYALGCHLDDAQALERLRRIRGFGAKHHLTLMCRDLSEIADYAMVDDARFRILKTAIPGSYTFILRARRQVPRRVMHQRHKTDRLLPRQHIGWHHRHPIPFVRQRDERVRGGALHQHAGPDMGDVACGLKPCAQTKFTAQQQQWLLSQRLDLQDGATGQSMRP